MSLKAEEVNFEESWRPLEKLVLKLLNNKYNLISRQEWHESFFDVYRICVAIPIQLASCLYNTLKGIIEKHVSNLHKFLKIKDIKNDVPNLLTNYQQHWVSYQLSADDLNNLFGYLNNQHLKRNKNSDDEGFAEPVLEVKDLCLYIWKQKMVEPLISQLVVLLIDEITQDRLGNTTNQTVIKDVIYSLAEVQSYKKDNLELYRESFEKAFLKTTGNWYKIKADKYREEHSCSEYLKKVLQIIDLETLRCTKLIHNSSKDKVIKEVRARMVADHAEYLQDESERMVKSDNWLDLGAIYKLLKPIENGLKKLMLQVQSHITQVGLEAINQVNTSENPPKTFVDSFICVHKKYSCLVQNVFKGDQIFVGALDKACSAVINHKLSPQQPCRSPELLAKYCDSLLRKSSGTSNNNITNSKGLSETEIDEKLSLSIVVFKYIDDKDVFQKFYAKNMARRLILSQMASMDAEELMINKLKQVCGYEFTAKLHKMYTDIDLSENLKKEFHSSLKSRGIQLGIDFSIYVLQAGSWPLGQTPPMPNWQLPLPLISSVKGFEEFYTNKFQGRKLTWLYHHSTADIKICYVAKRDYLVTMQNFHLAIVLMFEKNDVLTYGEILKGTQLTEEQLNKHLTGLLEVKLLYIEDAVASTSFDVVVQADNKDNSQEREPKFNSATNIKLNMDFFHKKSRFKVNVVQRDNPYQQIRESGESEQTHTSVDEDRKLYIQAAIVRIMKARKAAKHNQLIDEVIGLTKNNFTPSIPMIKKCIETLIEKQYLERKAQVTDEYIYVA